MYERFRCIALVVTTLGSLVVITRFAIEYVGLGMLSNVFRYLPLNPYGFWDASVWIFAMILFASLISVLGWFPGVGKRYALVLKKHYKAVLLRVMISCVGFAVMSFVLTTVLVKDMFPSDESKKLFPQVAALGPAYVRTYATNGAVRHIFHDEIASGGPERGYSEIHIALYGNSLEHNGGWVIYMIRGADLSSYNEIRFSICGEKGNEVIGVKAKDAYGVEVQVPLSSVHFPKGRTTTDWQEVAIPFDHFGNVQFDFMENFSLYVTGDMRGTIPQTIFVGGFKLVSTD